MIGLAPNVPVGSDGGVLALLSVLSNPDKTADALKSLTDAHAAAQAAIDEADSKTADMAARETAVAARESAIGDREMRLQVGQDDLKLGEASLRTAQAAFEESSRTAGNDLTNREQALASGTASVAQREADVSARESAADGRDASLTARENAVGNRETQADNRDAALSAREAIIETARAALSA